MDTQSRISNSAPKTVPSAAIELSGSAGRPDLDFGEYRDGLVIFSERGPGFVGPSVLWPDGRHRFIGVHEDQQQSITLANFSEDGFYDRDDAQPLGSSSRRLIKAVVDEDDKFLVLGHFRSGEQAFCARLTETGAPDPDFGDNGQVALPYTAPWIGYGRRLALQPEDGFIVLALRNSAVGEPQRDVIVRLDRSGSFDPRFGTCGVVTAPEPNIAFEAVHVQADGKLIVAGRRGRKAMLMRYGTTGLPDKTFGGAGYLELEPARDGNAALFDIAVQPDQKIVVTGSADLSHNIALLTRVTAGGQLDPGFNAGVPWELPELDVSFALAVQEDGKIVSAGHINNGSRCWLMRHLSNGELDPDFGDNGISRVINIVNTTSYLSHLELQPDGKILISGRYATHSAVVRCHGN